MTDPFTMTHEALLDVLFKHDLLAAEIRSGNRVSFLNKRHAFKEEVQAGDLPELRLVPTGGTPHIFRTSNSSSCVRRWEIQVSTGDQRVNVKLLPIEWYVFEAMHGWEAVLAELTWCGKKFVKRCMPLTIQSGISNADLSRNVIGWATVWGCEIEMFFSSSDL